MRPNMFDLLSGEKSNLLNRSTRAVCGTFEREVIVRNSEVNKTKAKLKNLGYVIIGTGSAGQKSTKIWFNPAGVNI